MNAFTQLESFSRANPHVAYAGKVRSGATSALAQLWLAANVGPVITFMTGMLTGLLIPSGNWPAILIVIVAGVSLRMMAEAINERCVNVSRKE